MKKLLRKRPKLTVNNTVPVEPVVSEVEQENESPKEVISTANSSFNDLVEKAQGIADDCYDEVISPTAFKQSTYSVSDGRMKIVNDEMTKENIFTEYALSQLCNKLGIPASYIQKCLNSGKFDDCMDIECNPLYTLAVKNLSIWTERYGGNSVLLRNYQDKVRGVLSNRYSICDTPTILEVLGECLDVTDYKIKGHFLTPERFHLRLVGDKLNVKGEDLFSGIQIDSSDVGRSTLTVHYMIFKQVCTNGLVVSRGDGVLFKQKHLSIDPLTFKSGLSVALENIPSLNKWAKITIEEAMTKDEVDFDRISNDKMKDLIDKVKSLTSFDEKTCKETIDLMKINYTPNRWGMVNAITEIAQNYTLEKRLELEKIAGGLLIA